MYKGLLKYSILISLVIFCFRTSFAELTGNDIIKKVDAILNNITGSYIMELKVIRADKEPVVSKLKTYVKNGDKILARYLEPAREKGTGYLKVGEDRWLYLPNAQKTIRISGRQSLQGSDLSNDDILKMKLSVDYNAVITGEDKIGDEEVYVLHLKAKSNKSTYGALNYWINKETFLPVKTEYFAFSGKMLKVMRYSNVKEMGGVIRPTLMEIESKILKGAKTVITFLEADFNQKIPDYYFTRMYLQRGK